MAVCRECGNEKEVDWVGWCDDCLKEMERWVDEKEKEGKSAYGLEGWDE